VWLLNNDTVVDPDALHLLVKQMQVDGADSCGSTIIYYSSPDTCQARCGGTFSYIKGGPRGHIGDRTPVSAIESHPINVAQIDYIMGASLLVSQHFLERVGLLWEGYFLFYEEMDWAERGRRAKLRLTYAPKSYVFHKGGASTERLITTAYYGSPTDFYFLRGRILFTRRHRPLLLPLVMGRLLMQMVYAAFSKPRRGRISMMARWQFWFGSGPIRRRSRSRT
jgi:GT2 family glycosyltransferase